MKTIRTHIKSLCATTALLLTMVLAVGGCVAYGAALLSALADEPVLLITALLVGGTAALLVSLPMSKLANKLA